MTIQQQWGAWHPDPTGRYQLRWWDGIQWTDDVHANGVTTKDSLAQFGLDYMAEELLQAKGISVGDPALAQKMKADIVNRLETLTNRIAIESLPESEVPAFESLLDTNPSAEAVQQFIAARVPDLPARLAQGYSRFREIYLGT